VQTRGARVLLGGMKKVAAAPVQPAFGLEEFLAKSRQFRLGRLPTEQSHPRTRTLAELARRDTAKAVEAFRAVDLAALRQLERYAPGIVRLRGAIRATLEEGARIFLCGCGATGRLALNLEYLWRAAHPSEEDADRVRAFMAGGDAALVRSLEGFEDHPEYGARHLRDMGFRKNDLLIAITEGGETPYVIGAAVEAARLARRKPWFLYCNPDDVLCEIAERSKRVIEDPRIEKLNLTVGPMALSGSTRLQATTVQMAACGWALLEDGETSPQAFVRKLRRAWTQLDAKKLGRLVRAEAAVYRKRGFVTYRPGVYPMTVLTDTTERSPTFSLAPFDNRSETAPRLSWCYLHLPGARDAQTAWRQTLTRAPRPLGWQNLRPFRLQMTAEWIDGFDFSDSGLRWREKRRLRRRSHVFAIERKAPRGRLARLSFRLGATAFEAEADGLSPLGETLLLKLILNTHSTLVMGLMGRYAANVMTWVKPSNFKLIDRAIRYIDALSRGKHDYEEIAAALFAETETLQLDESVVLKTVARLEDANGARSR
jgi:N-acetylmuramic acid 6-phosphate etherase